MRGTRARVRDDSATDSDGSTTRTDTDLETETDSDNDLLPPSDSGPFSENEKVLAWHNDHIYEAKVMHVDYQMKEWRYKVHYLGWNKNWDEWVGVDRLMKYTEENVQIQRARNKKQDGEKSTKPGRASLPKPKMSGGRGKKRKNDSVTKEKRNMPFEKQLNIPLTLKKQLVDDYEFITHLGKLVKLPRTPTVDDILKKYHDYMLKKDDLISDHPVGELLKGLRDYFDKTLPVFLLYKSERQQYIEAIANDVSPSTVYGAEHFLRLFVKLPQLLDDAKIEEETLMEMQPKFHDILKFLQKNQSTFFLSTYHVPGDIEISTNKEDD